MGQHAAGSFPNQARYQAEAVKRAQALYTRTENWPAILFVTSHPPTTGPSAWLRFELLRQALWIAEALEQASPHHHFRAHPQCFLAIDPYALDSVPAFVAGMYAGLMHSQYLVWDRQASTQWWLQKKWLLAGTGHDRIAWRLLKALSRNPVLMVLAGGLPANARLFYAAREWAGTLKDARHKLAKQAIRYRVMSLLSAEIEGVIPTEDGHIPVETQAGLADFLNTLGYSPGEQRARLETLVADFKSEIPTRLRLWKILCARLVRRGIPLLVLPLDHSESDGSIRLGPYFEMTPETDVALFAKDFNAFYTQAVDKIAS